MLRLTALAKKTLSAALNPEGVERLWAHPDRILCTIAKGKSPLFQPVFELIKSPTSAILASVG